MWQAMKRVLAVVALAWPLWAGAAAAAAPLRVVASFSVIGDLAHQVGGDRIRLTTLVGPNGDAHVYEPRPADAAALAAAQVILINGLGLEGFLPRLIAASGTKAPVVVVTRGVAALPNPGTEQSHAGKGTEAEHEEGRFDPHAWQSVANAEIYVRNIAQAFCAADAAGCPDYRARAADYEQKLEALDAEVKAAIAAIPPSRRTVITSHDAFNYFQHEYGLRFLAPEGVSTEAEASAADVAALIRQVRASHASALFVENITNPKLIEQIARDTGVKVGGTLYSDALSPADGPASTYVDMMRHNVKTIADAIERR
jgi:zinc/manganese transport system substrate-binding protein